MFYVLAVCCTLGILLDNGQLVFSKPTTTYDQRQTGDVNVQIHVKDLQVVALLDSDLLEDYTDYDYAYDYADFTLKPIVKPTTSSPSVSTSSVKPWNTWPTKPSTSLSSTKPSNSSSTTKPSTSSSARTVPIQLVVESTTVTSNNTVDSPESIDKSEPNNGTAIKTRMNDNAGNQLFNLDDTVKFKVEEVDEGNSVSLKTREINWRKPCRSGYVMNKKGRCRSIQNRRRFSLVPLTLRLGSKVSEKEKFNVRKDLPIRVYKSEPLRQ